jgi:hypothetical protein
MRETVAPTRASTLTSRQYTYEYRYVRGTCVRTRCTRVGARVRVTKTVLSDHICDVQYYYIFNDSDCSAYTLCARRQKI